MNLNHQKVRVPGKPARCRLCGAHFDETIQGICPARVVRFVAPRLLEQEEPEWRWIRLDELREGAVFTTCNGILAVKSNVRLPSGECRCILLDKSEDAHFPGKNDTLVQEVHKIEEADDE